MTSAAGAPDQHDRIRGVVFDLGGTLKYQRNKEKETKAGVLAKFVLSKFDVPDDKLPPSTETKAAGSADDFQLRCGRFAAHWLHLLHTWKKEKSAVSTAMVLQEHTTEDMLKQCLTNLGVKQVDAKLVSEAARAYFELEVQNTVLFDGVEEMLAALHNKGLRLAIITNSADTIKQKEIIDRLDLTKWFDPIVISAECGFRKPDSRIFRLVLDRWSAAAERAGEPAVERHQVVMVGDRTSRDVIGARRVGMRAVLCVLNDKQAANYAKSQDMVKPDRVIRHMKEMAAAIDSMDEEWHRMLHRWRARQAKHNASMSAAGASAAAASGSASAAGSAGAGSGAESAPQLERKRSVDDHSHSDHEHEHEHEQLIRMHSPSSRASAAAAASPTGEIKSGGGADGADASAAAASGPATAPARKGFRPVVIGYLFNPKKLKTFVEDGWFDTAYREDVRFVPIDLSKPLEQQGPFDIVMQKLTDDLVRSSSDKNAAARIALVDKFLAAHPEICVVDDLKKVRPLLDRSDMHALLSQAADSSTDSAASASVRTPPSFVVRLPLATAASATSGEAKSSSSGSGSGSDEDRAADLVDVSGRSHRVQLPVVCKPLQSCGSAESHRMTIVTRRAGFASLAAGDYLVQRFVNHNALLFKVYVLGSENFIVVKPSLPNVPDSETRNLAFDSQLKPPASWTSDSAASGGTGAPPTAVPEAVRARVESISAQLRTRLGLSLFGYDLVLSGSSGSGSAADEKDVAAAADAFVVDVNYFPSYERVDRFPQRLVTLLLDAHARHVATLRAAKQLRAGL